VAEQHGIEVGEPWFQRDTALASCSACARIDDRARRFGASGRGRRGVGREPRRGREDPRRQGQAAGAIVGAVMKATKGQADAARVRELALAACS